MIIDTNTIISVTDANKNFSSATRIADQNGQAVIFKGNKPKYLLIDIEQNPVVQLSEEEKIELVGKKILKEHIDAFKELAKWLRFQMIWLN